MALCIGAPRPHNTADILPLGPYRGAPVSSKSPALVQSPDLTPRVDESTHTKCSGDGKFREYAGSVPSIIGTK